MLCRSPLFPGSGRTVGRPDSTGSRAKTTLPMVRTLVRRAVDWALAPVGLAILLRGLLAAMRSRRPEKPRLLWGTHPIIALPYCSRAMEAAGYQSDVVAIGESHLAESAHFQHTIIFEAGNPLFSYVRHSLACYRFLAAALGSYDIFHYYFDAGLLYHTPLRRIEIPLIKVAGAKLVVFPFGSDAFVYDTLSDLLWRGALMLEYGMLGDQAGRSQERIRRVTRQADIVVGCLVHVANLPRWDILPLTCYPVDAGALAVRLPATEGVVRIAHSANHRGFKGTDFLVEAVERLRREGHDIELTIIERKGHAAALATVAETDIYVDQLNAGYALAAMEGMAQGKVVISHIDDTPHYRLFRRYSYLDECPIVPATPETIADVLRDLISRREEWPELGARMRAYCERRHSFSASAEMWEAVYDRIWRGKDVDLINFYHPVERARRTPGSLR